MPTEQNNLINLDEINATKETNYGALSTLVTVFFFWEIESTRLNSSHG